MPTLPSSEIRRAAVVVAPLLAQIGDCDERELEALRPVDGHQPDRIEILGLERGLALALLDQVALGDEVDEAAHVAPGVGLVLAREAHQLADVRHPPVAGAAASSTWRS